MLKEEVYLEIIKTYEERITVMESTMEIILEDLEDAKECLSRHLKEQEESLENIAFLSGKPGCEKILETEKILLQLSNEAVEHKRDRIAELNEKLKKNEAELAKAKTELEDVKERLRRLEPGLPCETCFYFGLPGDAPEGNEPDCMWQPSDDDGWERPCDEMTEKQRYMLKGMGMLFRKFDVFLDSKNFSAVEVRNILNQVYNEILGKSEC